MPYNRITELPDSVKDHLPTEAQQIYKEAFNHAWEEYADREDREATAHKVAWAAVKKKYRKSGVSSVNYFVRSATIRMAGR